MVQIHTLAPNASFTFTNTFDGDAATRFVKIGNNHYRKESAVHGVCIPISRCSVQIRTLVRPC